MTRLLLAALLASAAFATSAQSIGVSTQVAVQGGTADVATRDVRDNNCVRETGSRIITAQNRRELRRARAQHDATAPVTCDGFGRSYTQDDIRSTGAVDVADALRRLDPSIH